MDFKERADAASKEIEPILKKYQVVLHNQINVVFADTAEIITKEEAKQEAAN